MPLLFYLCLPLHSMLLLCTVAEDTTQAIDHTFDAFTGVIDHAGCWENTRKACKSRAEGEWFTSFLSTHEALRPSHALFPWQLKRSLEEEKRVGFFKNAYRNVRKACFDRRTTQSEFCFEINILCDRRSVQWRTMKFEVRKTALRNKLTLTW